MVPTPSRRTMTSPCASKKLLARSCASLISQLRSEASSRCDLRRRSSAFIWRMRKSGTHGAAGGTEQGGDADRERVRIVTCSLRQRARQEAESDAERHRRHHNGADDEGESRRVMMAGFRRVTRGNMVPIPARPVGRSLWRRRAQAWFIDVTRAIWPMSVAHPLQSAMRLQGDWREG